MSHRAYRATPAICLWCPRSALTHGRYPHLSQSFCSQRCEAAYYRNRSDTEAKAAAYRIRRLLGLAGDSRHFTRPELVAMARRLERVMPAGALSRMPAPHRSNGGVGMATRKVAS